MIKVIMTEPATVTALPGSVIIAEDTQAKLLFSAGVAKPEEGKTEETGKKTVRKRAAKKED